MTRCRGRGTAVSVGEGDSDGVLPLEGDWVADPERRFTNMSRASAARRRAERPFTARQPCPRCNTTDAYLEAAGDHDAVRCGICGKWLYHAPKTETGKAPRTVANLRPGIKAGQRARILDRDMGRCVLCGSTERLQVGHMLSVEDGYELGLENALLFSDANLAALCEACTLGLGSRSMSPRTYFRIRAALLTADRRAVPETAPLVKASDTATTADRDGVAAPPAVSRAAEPF